MRDKRTEGYWIKLTELIDLNEAQAFEVIGAVREAVSRWEEFAQQGEVSRSSITLIRKALQKVDKESTG